MDHDSGRVPAGAGHVLLSLLHQRSTWVLRSDGGLRSIWGGGGVKQVKRKQIGRRKEVLCCDVEMIVNYFRK
jgi:hypothetical protein